MYNKAVTLIRLKSAFQPNGSLKAGVYPWFLKHEPPLRILLLPPWMGCQAITGLPLASHSLVSIYTAGWNEALRELSVLSSNPTQGTQPGLELEPSTLNIIGPCPSR